MNKKRAFTLIELLVVIAIIAILAAILFPVFAQAKLAAKKSASLSNIKQITLANIMYENDYDDNFVLFSQNPFNTYCGQIQPNGTPYPNGGASCLAPPFNVTYNWPILLQPYIKSLGLFVDPATGDPQNYFGGGPNANTEHQSWHPQYGYNYLFLSPLVINGLSTSGWLPSGYLDVNGVGRSSTTAVAPANTVMFTSSAGTPVVGTALVAGAQYSTPDETMLTDPGTGCQLYYATNRLTYVNVGASTTPAGSSKWGSQWVKTTPVGEITGITRALNPYNGANVGWVDGHAKSMTADALAAGTDFGSSTTASGYAGFGSVITDITKYLWTLDGTTRDAGTGPSGTACQPIG
ncbi:MAG TPA: prepilin-type N-terminal cleavage/methylation domain-containing protein [Fimbriimonadaceae bacterium]|jgi:prepilin-type N-terminal cleavage/methylation domain-containing protein/prepilin-type processing-associated H-X9-DG protein